MTRVKAPSYIITIHDRILQLDKEIFRRTDLWKRNMITAREERDFDQETLRWLEEARPIVFDWLINKGTDYLFELNETEAGRSQMKFRTYLLKAIDTYIKELKRDRRVMFQFPRLSDMR